MARRAVDRERILVADCDPDLRIALVDLLTDFGYVVVSVASGTEAATLLHSFRPHVLVFDLRLEGVDGLELARRAGAMSPRPVRIAHTAEPRDTRRKQAQECGVDEYLIKPVAIQTIIQILERRLESASRVPSKVPVRAGRTRPEPCEHDDSPSYRQQLRTLARNLRRLRSERGWTQEDAAARCQMAPRLLQRLEAARLNATLMTLARLTRGFEVGMEALFAHDSGVVSGVLAGRYDGPTGELPDRQAARRR